MALSPFIYRVWFLFLPYQNLSHFRTFLDFFADLTLYRNVTAQRKVYLLYLIGASFALQNLYFWVFLPPPMDRLRQADLVSLVFQTDDLNLALVGLGLMFIYFIHVLCFAMKLPFLRLQEDILFRDTHRTLTGVAYGRFTEQTTVRIVILVAVNLLLVFILVIGKLVEIWLICY